MTDEPSSVRGRIANGGCPKTVAAVRSARACASRTTVLGMRPRIVSRVGRRTVTAASSRRDAVLAATAVNGCAPRRGGLGLSRPARRVGADLASLRSVGVAAVTWRWRVAFHVKRHLGMLLSTGQARGRCLPAGAGAGACRGGSGGIAPVRVLARGSVIRHVLSGGGHGGSPTCRSCSPSTRLRVVAEAVPVGRHHPSGGRGVALAGRDS